MKEIREDTNKWSWFRRINLAKISLLSKAIDGFNATLIS